MAAIQSAFFSHCFVGPPNKIPKLVHFQREVVLQTPSESIHKELSDLQSSNAKLTREVEVLQKKLEAAKKLGHELQNELKKERKPFFNSKKTFADLDSKTKSHKKQRVKVWLSKQFKKLPSEWKVKEVNVLIDGEAHKLCKFCDSDEEEEEEEEENTETLRIQKALKAKDDGDISDVAYNELKQLPNSNLPPLNSIKIERKRQNSIIPIHEYNNGIVKGCRRSIREIVEYMLNDNNFKNSLQGKEVVELRFSGDGRKTTKKMGSVMTTFSMPVESKRSPDTEYCISIYDGKESRDILETFINDVFTEMEDIRLKGITLDDKTLKIDWILCADWKFMAILLGINSPCSEYFCLWCECCKKLIRDFSIADWEITRTYENCVERAQVHFTGERKGVQAIPLINVSFDKVIPDTLHLLLRIRGKLLNQVACWAIEQKSTDKMEHEMSEIGVAFNFYESQDQSSGKKSTKWTSLDCDDLEKVIKNLKLENFLRNMADKSRTSLDTLTKVQLVAACQKYGLRTKGSKDVLRVNLKEYLDENKIPFQVSSIQTFEVKSLDVNKLQTVWRDFEILADALKANPDSLKYLEPESFKLNALKWVKAFRAATFDEDVIPYIHVLVYHIPQFLKKYGTLHHFNCQTVEKKNHLQNRTFHRGSQKGGRSSNYTVQVMEKENRKLFARLENLERIKRKYIKKQITEKDC